MHSKEGGSASDMQVAEGAELQSDLHSELCSELYSDSSSELHLTQVLECLHSGCHSPPRSQWP